MLDGNGRCNVLATFCCAVVIFPERSHYASMSTEGQPPNHVSGTDSNRKMASSKPIRGCIRLIFGQNYDLCQWSRSGQ